MLILKIHMEKMGKKEKSASLRPNYEIQFCNYACDRQGGCNRVLDFFL